MLHSSTTGLRLLTFSLLFLAAKDTVAQGGTGIVKGRVLNSVTGKPFTELQVNIPGAKKSTTTSTGGNFSIADVPTGQQMVIISGFNIKNDTIVTKVLPGNDDLGTIFLTPNDKAADDNGEIPTIVLDDNTTQDDENTGMDAGSSGAFYASNGDEFLRIAIFTFGPYRFRPRGYGNTDIQFNGFPLQNLQTGFAPFAQLGGLNDVLRDRVITYGLRPGEYSFGSVNGSTYINATAADQRRGGNVSYYNSNRSYRNRVMATYSSGLMKNGWAYSLSASRRWADEGYIPGTYYDGKSFYGAVSKVYKKQQFNLTGLAAPTYRGLAATEIQEVFDLAGSHYYNENWGYQNGKKRNARSDSSFQPIIVASHTYRPSDKTRWTTSLGYKYGKYKRSGLDFYNAANPSPTYYRNLPSYALQGGLTPRQSLYDITKAEYEANPDLLQIQWDNLYMSNYMNTATVTNVNGITGNNVTGKQSMYVIGNRVDDMRTLSFNSIITHALNEKLTVDGGLNAISQYDEYYKELADLMGGEFFVNYYQFASQAIVNDPNNSQNNLNNPNAIIKTGDKYSYDYIFRTLKTNAWGQLLYSYNKIDLFAAAAAGNTSFSREGLYRNGLFPNNSFGRTADQTFFTYKAKAGATFRIDNHHTVFAYGGYITDAPTANNTYIAPGTRDFVISNPQVSKTQTIEGGYNFKAKGMNFRLTGYATEVNDLTLIKRFWNDDPDIQSYVNYVMQNVSTRSMGVEMLASVKIISDLTATAGIAVGESYYNNRPTISIYQDNIPSMVPATHTVYIKDYYLGVGPQSVYSMAFRYSPRGYWANLSFNYMDRNYVEINPERRTELAVDLVDPTSQKWNNILRQEKLPSAFVVNVAGGKTFDISKYFKPFDRKTQLVLSANIGNLLNNQNIKSIGYEQLRYDLANQNSNKFPNKYGYAYGLNYGISAAIRF